MREAVAHVAIGLVVLVSACTAVAASEPATTPSADELLRRSIAYHDPEGRFLGAAHRWTFLEKRPDEREARRVEVVIDVPGRRFERRQERPEGDVVAGIAGDTCAARVGGREPTADAMRAFRLGCDQIRRTRDYYTYLWGLPMKLRDPGTRLGSVEAATFEGREAWRLRVTYDEHVGTDVWYVLFDRSTFAMIGYGFYKDESVGDGEKIVLTGEVEAAGMRVPEARAWFTHLDGRHLGTDVLVGIGPLPPE